MVSSDQQSYSKPQNQKKCGSKRKASRAAHQIWTIFKGCPVRRYNNPRNDIIQVNIQIIMMLDYQNIIDLLSDIQNQNKANQVAEDIEKRSDDPKFITLLQHAIRDQQLTHNAKLAAVVVFSRVITEKCSEWNEGLLIDCIMEVITDSTVEYRLKQSLEENLTTILELSSQHYFTQVLLKAAQIIYLLPKNLSEVAVEQNFQDNTADKLKTALLILRCLLNANSHFGVLAAAIQQSLLEATLSINIGLSAKDINAVIDLAQFWKSIIQKAKEEILPDHSQFLKWICRNQMVTEWVFQLYSLDHLPGQLCYINPQSNLDHEHLNEMKTATTNLHANILMGIERSRQTEDQELSTRHIAQIPVIINTICLCTLYDSFITGLIGVLILMIKNYARHFTTICDRILHIIAFPLLAINDEEQQLFADDPVEFNNLAEDCCDRQSFGLLKTQTARLLETVCDCIRGTAEYTIQHAIISIKVRLALNHDLTVESAQHFLSLQQALFILSVLSYRLGKHEKEMNEVRSALTVSNMIERSNPIEMARCFQFLAYNYQEIYPDSVSGQQWVYFALKTSIQQSQPYPTLAYAALDFISNVIENYFSEQFVLEYMSKCALSSNQMQFKIFIKIISKHFTKFSERGLCQALDGLLNAVIGDLKRYEAKDKTHTMDINHSLLCIRKILEKIDFSADKNQLKSKIWEFVSHLESFKRVNVDDQVVKIITSFIRIQGITPKILDIYPRIIELYTLEYYQTPYIVFINEVAMKVSDPVSLGVYQALYGAIQQLHCNVMSNPTSVTDNLALGTSLLVMQHIIAVFGESLSKEVIYQVAELGFKIVPVSDEPEDKLEPIVLARALNLVFMCHMYSRDERALKRLLLFQDALLFRGHDLKVFTVCLTKELFRETDLVAVTEMINLLIKAIWNANEASVPDVKSKRNPLVKKKPTVIRIKKIADYEACLKTMTQPFPANLLPELQLRNAIQKMQHSNSMLYQAIIRSLPNTLTEHLRHLMSEVTFEGHRRRIVRAGQVKISNNEPKSRVLSKKRNYDELEEEEEFEDQEEESSNKKQVAKKKRKEEETVEPSE